MQQRLERRMEICGRNSPIDMKIREKGPGEGAPGTWQRFLCSPCWRPGQNKLMDFHDGANIYPAGHGWLQSTADGCARRRLWSHGECVLKQAPGRTCCSVDRGSWCYRFSGRTCDPRWGSILNQRIPEGLVYSKFDSFLDSGNNKITVILVSERNFGKDKA